VPLLSDDELSRRPVDRVARHVRAGVRWARLVLPLPVPDDLRVSYGHDRVPAPGAPARGGTAKAQRLAERFPNHPADFTLLYLGSSWLPRDLGPLLRVARRRHAPVVLNQDGAAYPAWAPDDWEARNVPLRAALQAARHVLYQSAFARESCDRFLGEPRGSWEILPNAVDVDRFAPAPTAPEGDPVVVLGGDQYQAYKLDLGLRSLAVLRRTHPGARLVVTGRLAFPIEPLVAELGLEGAVEVVGRYAQRDLLAILHRAHVYLHPKVNDPCPSSVIEALACGVPVVYAASGGTVELVGDEGGVGVPHPTGWERQTPPAPDDLAAALAAALDRRAALSEGARRRAVERDARGPRLERHPALDAELTSG
jgi:glycosyltransferase involved in cell wall biosynthesis